MEYQSWMCLICGWIYDEEAGLPDEGIAPGTRWEDVPINWTCPECGARKEDFEMVHWPAGARGVYCTQAAAAICPLLHRRRP
jgi:rubredoxin